ncbi:thymidine kinase [Aquihabitans sp. G128]|uniref:thymidine kinase n=1 Tax=Aquihabitans sp. G128 TaxID=2849779 RepID=UPI001C2100E9|nr:thymidine kinase [Aquihabitans sp. G128]QXC62589.1 thymidine kinase [Aquihabitans sp. G128]
MATLRFSFGTMGSGKSTLALQIHHNLSSRGLRGLLCTHLDREGAQVSSRLGVAAAAVDVGPKLDLFAMAEQYAEHHGGLQYLVCDEAQFYAPHQIDELARVVDELGADVHALGLLTDFRGKLFDATARLLEVADERCELQVEARCWCGARATHNARLVDGVQVYDGDQVVLGDVEALGDTRSEALVAYELLCRRHWLAGETGRLDDAVTASSFAVG